ncbi:uncharacterized protein LOC133172182 [Saccostrea echinata]|uniref:uncharacterized protein LOC133172182 n=1 Tax=Saccostrea echinata TaxID=191078 RepID=UPI002A7EC78A|nr:uncharacterized protein LOC133172182 [Saccostrea echinata]
MLAISSLLFAGLSVSLIPGTAPQCCPPLQFQTYIDTLESLSNVRDKRFQKFMYSYDAKSRRTATHVVAESKEDEFDQIDDFAANKSYSWAKGQCCVSATGRYNQTCIPAGAKLVRRSFMGVSPNTIKVDTYMFMVSGLTRLVTVGPNCTPVESAQITSKIPQPDGQFMWIFYNMTMGIKDASIFTPPKICFKKGIRVERRPDALPHLMPF